MGVAPDVFTVKEKFPPSQITLVVVVVLPAEIPVISFTVKAANPLVVAKHGPLGSVIFTRYSVPLAFAPLVTPTPTLPTVKVTDDAVVVPDAPAMFGNTPMGLKVLPPSVLDSH